MLSLTAEAVRPEYAEFRTWLADKAERTSPFCEFDLRALSEEHRKEFWRAAQQALERLFEKFGPRPEWPQNMFAGESLVHLLDMHRSIAAGEPPSALNDLRHVVAFNGQPENLKDLWRC